MCVNYWITCTVCDHQESPRFAAEKMCDEAEARDKSCPLVAVANLKYPRACSECLENSLTDPALFQELTAARVPSMILDSEGWNMAERLLGVGFNLGAVTERPPRNYNRPRWVDGNITQQYANNINAFAGELSATDTMQLLRLEKALDAVIWAHMVDPNLQNITKSQMRFYLQIRDALFINCVLLYHAGESNVKNRSWLVENVRQFRRHFAREDMIRRLQEVIRPVNLEQLRLQGGDLICRVCRVEFGQQESLDIPAEEAVQLPCDHIYGKHCLEVWMREAPDGMKICTLCRKDFGFPDPSMDVPAGQDYDDVDFDGSITKCVVVEVRLEDADEVDPFQLNADYTILYANLLRRAEERTSTGQNPPPPLPPWLWWVRMLRGEGRWIPPLYA